MDMLAEEFESPYVKRIVERGIGEGAKSRKIRRGAVVEAGRGVVDYWSRRNIAGLLLMPATRHNIVHWNEALQLKKRRQ
jgi:hypothetical protein